MKGKSRRRRKISLPYDPPVSDVLASARVAVAVAVAAPSLRSRKADDRQEVSAGTDEGNIACE